MGHSGCRRLDRQVSEDSGVGRASTARSCGMGLLIRYLRSWGRRWRPRRSVAVPDGATVARPGIHGSQAGADRRRVPRRADGRSATDRRGRRLVGRLLAVRSAASTAPDSVTFDLTGPGRQSSGREEYWPARIVNTIRHDIVKDADPVPDAREGEIKGCTDSGLRLFHQED
jgi:hypothetical protein